MLNNMQSQFSQSSLDYSAQSTWMDKDAVEHGGEQSSPEQILDLRSQKNSAHIQDVKRNKLIYVVLVPVNNLPSKMNYGIGRRSEDGEFFSVDIEIDREIQTHTWSWSSLIAAIHDCCGDAKISP